MTQNKNDNSHNLTENNVVYNYHDNYKLAIRYKPV